MSCEEVCVGVIERKQDPADKLDYSVDFEAALTRFREPSTTYALNTVVRSRVAPGLEYKATTAGRSGTIEPRWPTAAAGTVTDGSVVWTAQAISTNSLTSTLASAAWTVDSGLTSSGQAESWQRSTIHLSGGTDGQTYTVICTGTMVDGRKFTGIILLTVKRRTSC